MRRALIVLGVVVSSSALLLAQALFPKPVKVFGDPNFVGTAANPLAFDTIGPNWVEGRELNGPQGVALDTSVSPPILYIADTGNSRVLAYRYATQLVAGSVADIVIGQIDDYANQAQNPAQGGRQLGLNGPTGLAVDSTGNLYVADTGNNRILRFPQPFNPANSSEFPSSSLVIGQKSLATSTANLNGIGASTLALSGAGRTGIAFDSSGNLWVADSGNNRVLRFPAAVLAANAPFPAADMVLGQSTFVSNAAAPTRTTLTALAAPNGISLDSSGNLYVTDQAFRVLVYNSPLTTSQAAAAILGVDMSVFSFAATTQIGMNNPTGVLGLGTGVATGPLVADTGNNRLLYYPPQTNWPLPSVQFSPSASTVAGQASFTVGLANQGNADASASSFSSPVDLAATSTELYVVDSANNRVLVFPANSTGYSSTATRVIGQLDFPFYGNNLVDGKGFAFPGSFPAGIVLDNSVSPAHLYVADTLNNRVLGFKDFRDLQNGQPADLVIGQPDFNRIVPNYPSGMAATPSASGLSDPTSLAVDSAGNLYVTDFGNSRVLRFPAPYASGKTALEAADLVLGQESFTSTVTDATPNTLSQPAGVALTSGAFNTAATSGYLAVVDSAQNRVLFYQKPFISGMSASFVLGQSNLNGSASGSVAAALSSPRGVAVDPQDRVLVADSGNGRVQIFDQTANLVNGSAPLISLSSFQEPLSIATGPAGDFWVADYRANALVHFPSVPNLPLTNDASDTVLQTLGPHSAFVDPYNNLLVTDALNRILYFAPQINLTNAANYSTRALAAGTVAALFPTVPANAIANGTAAAPAGQFPLPTTLSDTQVTVGGTPVPLLFVSPGQDNVILPQALPTAGTANLQAIRASTGQIFGAAEIELQTTSPGLFTQGATGSGQVLAVNVQDSTVNSPVHPVVRGQYVILYGTGVGPVPNPPADGAPATGQPASDLPVVQIASEGTTTNSSGVVVTLPKYVPANVTYSGLAPGFAGLWQINVQIPLTAQTGNAVVIQLYEKDIPNLDQGSTLTTTLAVQ